MKKISLLALMCLMVMAGMQKIYAAQLYAYQNGTQLVICYDNNMSSHSNAQPAPTSLLSGWQQINASFTIRSIILDASIKNARPTSLAYWFTDFNKISTVYNLNYLNTSDVEDMSFLFAGCCNITTIDISQFNTAKVTDMSNMFSGCKRIKTLDITHFDMNKLNGTDNMFYQCDSLQTIYCNWDMRALRPSRGRDMFFGCTRLKGGYGTQYNALHVDATYAHPDYTGHPGYFTGKYCPAPTNISYSSVSTSSAVISWDQDSRQSVYEIRYMAQGAAGYQSVSNLTGNSYTLTGLRSNTRYDVWLVSRCNYGGVGYNSVESQVISFLTPEEERPPYQDPCPAPTNITISDITASTAKVSWVPADNSQTKWIVTYKPVANDQYQWVDVFNTPSCVLCGLSPNTTYEFFVRAICDTEEMKDLMGTMSEFKTFTTGNPGQGVEDITPSNSPSKGEKILRDGQLLILVGDKMYDARGVEVR